MSLRLRLVVIIGVALSVLWSGSAVWMWRDVSHDLQRMLDDRLAMSAHMVAGLLSRQLVLAGEANTGIADTLVTVPATRGMACRIRSMRGEVIAATHGAPPKPVDTPAPGFDTRVIQGTSWRTFTLHAGGLSITTADRVAGRDMLLYQIALTVGVPFLIAAIGGLLALWLGTGRGLRPLQRLRGDLATRGPDALEPLPTRRLPKELRPLVETLNELLRRTQQAMQRERHFTNDAAHELRTPLTAISTHLQVARLSSPQAAQPALNDAEAGVERLQSTLEQLLLLARVEGRLPFGEADGIDVASVVRQALEDSGEQVAERVVHDTPDEQAMLAVAPALARVALRNLLENALRHAPEDTSVHVSSGHDARHVWFRVVDRGPGLPAAALEQATRRFWRAGSTHGSGLGLTIVAAIAERYGGRLELANQTPGLAAVLWLPRVA